MKKTVLIDSILKAQSKLKFSTQIDFEPNLVKLFSIFFSTVFVKFLKLIIKKHLIYVFEILKYLPINVNN